ncbi:hypothetical protein [Bacillus sp. FJAT-29814]|uniref:hypothetical protein n=1 Tax=Bacillus sp. FJAT-29814 TaxID=1729688 RepID=UPI000A54932D|nr:hypothetical protein [Bacillus sp. FJAT-29814]
MKNFKYLIAFLGIISFFIVGCSNLIKDEEQYIDVEKRIGDENRYEEFNKITHNDQVQKVREIVDNIDWEKAQVSMVRPPDYRFAFQYENPEIETKVALYELWISPNNDKVELVINAESKYVQLDKNHSAELLKY